MTHAYNETWLHNLQLVKEAKRWMKQGILSTEQYENIHKTYTSAFYHPNIIIRVLLFIATLFGLTGVTGLLILITQLDTDSFSVIAVLYGLGSFFALDLIFIQRYNHYKSGVTEALLYHSIGFTGGGIAGLTDFNPHVTTICFLVLTAFAAYRYLDLVSTLAATGLFAYLIFFECYWLGGFLQYIIPLVFISLFTPLYFFVKRINKRKQTALWSNGLILVEALCLLLIYAAGNYLIVREMSIELLDLYLEPGMDIPMAIVLYFLTVMIPALYLYAGIKKKDVVLLRVSLIVLAFSVFTFKYYYGFGHPEITLTVSGVLLLIISIALFRYLRIIRNGFTHENIMNEKWAGAHPEAFIISQTMGGNKSMPDDDSFTLGGGSFGGGGSGGKY